MNKFLSFYDIETKYNNYVINIDKVVKWFRNKKKEK